MKDLSIVVIKTIAFLVATANIAVGQTGGQYEITQFVIAAGGGKSESPQFSVAGTIGQAVAGTNSSNLQYSASGGFWQSNLVPTAAGVTVTGRVMSNPHAPLRLALVTMQDDDGVSRTVRTGTFGYFRFDNVEPGRTYIITASHRRYRFVPFALSVTQDLNGLVISPLN